MFWEKYKKIAHRGFHSEDVPENSMTAFARAIEKNYAIELDVQITRDNIVVVFHDYDLVRMTGVNKEIENCTYDEIKDLKLKNTEEKIPTLKDVLKLVNGRVGLLIEIKNNGIPGKLEKEVVKILKNYKGHYMVQSFNILTLIWFKKNAPKIIRGKLAAKSKTKISDKISEMFLYMAAKPHFLSYKFEDINWKVNNLCALRQMKLLAWTIRTESEYKEASKKYKGIIFENIKI